jgi:hypothetical protein
MDIPIFRRMRQCLKEVAAGNNMAAKFEVVASFSTFERKAHAFFNMI